MTRTSLVIMGVLATGATAAGGLLLLLYGLWPLLGRTRRDTVPLAPDDLVSLAAELAVLGVYGALVGLLVLRHVWRDWRGGRSAPFQVPLLLTGLSLAAFPLALGAGVRVLDWAQTPRGYIFPLAALLAILLPALVMLGLAERAGRMRPAAPLRPSPGGLAGRDSQTDPTGAGLAQAVLGPPTWRRITGAFAWGLGGATVLASILEIGVALVGALLLAVGLIVTGHLDVVQQWTGSDSLSLGDDTLRALAGNPWVILAGVLAVGLVVPVIEEGSKSLAVVLLRRQLTVPRDAFLYGAAAGVGFGMLENTFYNNDKLSDWAVTALLRFSAILLHALATGLIGLGWYHVLRRHDRRRGALLALAAIAVHGIWNGSQVVILAWSLQRGVSDNPFSAFQTGGLFAWAVLAWTVGMTLLGLILLVAVPWRLAHPQRGPGVQGQGLGMRGQETAVGAYAPGG